MLELGHVMLQLVQIVCLDLQVLVNLVGFLFQRTVLLSNLLQLDLIFLALAH